MFLFSLNVLLFEYYSISMADGVENAAVVCCFMTPKYQNSRNCEKELLYAERRRVSIIPCRLTRDWEPSTWLGLVIAGLVWIDFRDTTDANIDLKIDKLIGQIRIVAGKRLNCLPPPVPPRPDKELLRQRLLNIEMRSNSNHVEPLDEKKENRYLILKFA